MVSWLQTLLVSHENTDGRDRRELALVGGDGSCPVCDHPFGHMSHVCLA